MAKEKLLQEKVTIAFISVLQEIPRVIFIHDFLVL